MGESPLPRQPRIHFRHPVAGCSSELIHELTAGRALLMVEHDMGVVFNLADRIAVLAQEQVLAFDTPAAVRADARVKVVYLGESAEPDASGERT